MKFEPGNLFLRGWIILALSAVCTTAMAQNPTSDVQFGLSDGIRFNAPDSSLGLQIGLRLQTQLFDNIELDEDTYRPLRSQPRIQLRRARLQFKGYLLKNKFSYYMQLEFDRGQDYISDAQIRWHPGKAHTIGAGQFKLFEDRQNRMSAAKLQLVERAVVSGQFNEGYDMGVYWEASVVPQNSFGMKTYVAVTQGEMLNNPTATGGFHYIGRMEILPMGGFHSGGDYTATTLVPQPDPKLSLGFSGSYNMDAYSLYGSGFSSGTDSDILTLHADYIFKYQHFSMFGEFSWREVENEVLRISGDELISDVMGGYGFFVQSGLMVGPKVELAARYEEINPWSDDPLKRAFNYPSNHYSVGTNYYVSKHNLKIQSMLTLVEEMNRSINDRLVYFQPRLQFQLNF